MKNMYCVIDGSGLSKKGKKKKVNYNSPFEKCTDSTSKVILSVESFHYLLLSLNKNTHFIAILFRIK